VKKITDTVIQAIWAESNIDKKKALLVELVDNFQYKAKQAHFMEAIDKAKSLARLDKLSADLLLVGDGHRIVKTY
jgi:hypothetical protein